MNANDFAYWLRGFFDLASVDKDDGLSPKQVKIIQAHLDNVFEPRAHKPSAGMPFPETAIGELLTKREC